MASLGNGSPHASRKTTGASSQTLRLSFQSPSVKESSFQLKNGHFSRKPQVYQGYALP